MLLSDFAAATVLISFGVVIGKTSPLQLIVMALIEIVLFVINEVIGRKMLGAIDAGDTIFVHTFGAYFGLAASRVLYTKNVEGNKNEGSDYTHDLFSMIGTIFLWMFWPSFNAAATIPGDAQHRAVLNTYFSLCACVISAFAMSALMNEHKKFVMEHIQNATLAGGVAIGACADLMVQPFGALIIGALAGMLSVIGFEIVSPFMKKHFKIHDTCGVHNLHGMPGIFGALLSCILAVFATKADYGTSLTKIYPALGNSTSSEGIFVPAITPSAQATNQLVATVVTVIFAIIGGSITGLIMKLIGRFQRLDETYRHGATVVKLALAVGNISGGGIGLNHMMPQEAFFDDNLFFEVNEDKAINVMDEVGRLVKFDAKHHSRSSNLNAAKVSRKSSRTNSVSEA
jgi:ammonium transporter Rh